MADQRNTSLDDRETPATTPVLAEASLADLRALDPDGQARLVHRVLGTYQCSLGRLTGQLAEARSAGAWDQVSRVAHTLKSSSASIGALALSRLCAEIEGHVRAGDPAAAAASLQRFDAEVARVSAAVAEALASEEAAGS